MLWKPAAPVWLTKDEGDDLRKKGKSLLPICKLAKNGVYLTLVKDVRNAFEGSPLVKIDCKGMHASDYKKLGAKHKELVPRVLLSFDNEQILVWRGKEWKSMYLEGPSYSMPDNLDIAGNLDGSVVQLDYLSGKPTDDNYKLDPENIRSSPKMISFWKRAIESSKALLLDKINFGPDELLKKVEEFEGISQAIEHSYSAIILSSEDGIGSSLLSELEDGSPSENYDEDDVYLEDDFNDDEYYDSDSSELDSIAPIGSLPVDQIAEKLRQE